MSEFDPLDRALDELLADRSPRADASSLSEEEQRMLQMAQRLRGARREPPAPEFVDTLHDRLFPSHRRVSRRTAFVSGLGALAAGILAGFGIDRAVSPGSISPAGGWQTALVPSHKGTWVHVATVADVPDGAIRTFSAGSVQGFLLNKEGQYRALSRICTHMGCTLRFKQSDQSFVCPCHGAEFTLAGDVRYGPGGYYGNQLAPLPAIKVRVQGESIQVYSV